MAGYEVNIFVVASPGGNMFYPKICVRWLIMGTVRVMPDGRVTIPAEIRKRLN